MALSALRKSLESQVPRRPPAADKAVCTSPLFTGSATSKRLATSPLASHATPKRHAVTPALKQHDENNNEVGDQDGFVLVDRRRHRQRKQTAATPGAVHARQQPKPRPVQRRTRHRPDVIVIKAKDASKYADILRSLKSDPTLQQKVGSSVNNIRRSAAGALMLQLKKGVENASDLGEELGKMLGTAATASALLHTSTIEIKDLDECATKEEVTAALDALLGVPVSKRDPVKSLRKAYAGTQVAVVALPDDLAATALKLGHVRIGWVNCRIRAREEAARCYRCWSPGHLELPSGPEYHPGPPMMRILQLNLNHCEAAQDLLCDTISKLRIDVAILCEQYKNLAPPNTWLADADGQAAIWVHGGIPVQERPARVHPYFAWARIGGIFFFSVYAPPRLSEREFPALREAIAGKRWPHVAYGTTYVLAGIPPLALLGDERAWLYGRRREYAKDEERLATLSKWQEAWDRSTKARWTHRLIPNIRVWIERRHGELNYHLTQLLTGHGFFKHHSRRYDYNQSAQCPVCPSFIENAEHVFYHCPRFSEERERLHSLLYEVIRLLPLPTQS
ncbi:unnamed protein product [Trichogramma brassicae]|uniref:Reverse transcriptase zinc-binding domain-containing protein n=1 Tax=Trichogramma brassicae TaxID=86971 RepID=A0A6H5IQ26_9HYME|nr:unnamed protein product [Trichogramma brassicae]